MLRQVRLSLFYRLTSDCIFCVNFRSECARWVEAIEPAQSQTENERIYEEWGRSNILSVHYWISCIGFTTKFTKLAGHNINI